MFVRATVVAVTVSVLLACPHMCMLDTSIAYGQTVGCGCCSDEVPVDGYPGDDRSDDGQQDCLCHSAVLGSLSRPLEQQPPAVNWLAFANVASTASTYAVVTPTDFSYTHATQFPSTSSGRDIRTLISSRLL